MQKRHFIKTALFAGVASVFATANAMPINLNDWTHFEMGGKKGRTYTLIQNAKEKQVHIFRRMVELCLQDGGNPLVFHLTKIGEDALGRKQTIQRLSLTFAQAKELWGLLGRSDVMCVGWGKGCRTNFSRYILDNRDNTLTELEYKFSSWGDMYVWAGNKTYHFS
jgi:hypothetical protein